MERRILNIKKKGRVRSVGVRKRWVKDVVNKREKYNGNV